MGEVGPRVTGAQWQHSTARASEAMVSTPDSSHRAAGCVVQSRETVVLLEMEQIGSFQFSLICVCRQILGKVNKKV